MYAEFFTGVLKTDSGEEFRASWARTPFGCTVLREGHREPVHALEIKGVVVEENVTTVELPGLDGDMMETVVTAVLKGRILEKPGIKGKGDAVLFVLVNEALQKLEEASRDEDF
jgi:hypothetical protein